MIIIGVVSKSSERKIERLIKRILTAFGIKTASVQSLLPERLEALSALGIKAVILSLTKGSVCPLYLDVIVLRNIADITYELVKSVSVNTRLIYNTDSTRFFKFDHPNAIGYGMSYAAEATVSSIDSKSDGLSFVYCLQKPIISLSGRQLSEGEITIDVSDRNSGICDMLAAVTCGMICDAHAFSKIKI